MKPSPQLSHFLVGQPQALAKPVLDLMLGKAKYPHEKLVNFGSGDGATGRDRIRPARTVTGNHRGDEHGGQNHQPDADDQHGVSLGQEIFSAVGAEARPWWVGMQAVWA